MNIELYSERLVLRNLHQDDWANFLRLHQDPVVNLYIRAVEAEQDILAMFESRKSPWLFESKEWLSLVIEHNDTHEFVGLIGFYCDDVELKRAEVGYLITPEKQGFGFASESLKALTDWGTLQFGISKFIGICAKDNIASSKVLEKVGFIREGLLRQHTRIGATWFDDYYFGLLTADR